ncbi:MAG TPA: hypothetical protein VLY04_09035 [Bryobacteraceae bacterium]|nr:hypothetical protein [Bryobacteraceae bacterium]
MDRRLEDARDRVEPGRSLVHTGGFSPHGFVVLDFDGDTVWETYRVPNNIGLLKAQL